MLPHEQALYTRARAGDEDAMEELIRQHTPLIEALSRRFSWRDDARQSGYLALTMAIRRFDPARGCAFSTYAVPWILGEMRRAGVEKAPWRMRAAWHRAQQAAQGIRQREMREATVHELAHAAGISAGDMVLLMEHKGAYQTDTADESCDPRGEIWMERMLLRDLIDRLPPDDRQLLHLRMEGVKQKEAAALLHTSQSGISRKEKALMGRLRDAWRE